MYYLIIYLFQKLFLLCAYVVLSILKQEWENKQEFIDF